MNLTPIPECRPLIESLLAHADARPEQTALASSSHLDASDGAISYGELGRMIRRAAARLVGQGVERGGRVIICGRNSRAWAAAYFAIHMAGGVAVPFDADTPLEAIRETALHAEARLALTARPGLLEGHGALDIPCEDIVAITSPSSGTLLESSRCIMDETADLLYTTGTTGQKKGVLLTQSQIAHAARNINEFIGERPTDYEVVSIPLSHSFALGRLRVMARVGHTLHLEAGMRNPAALLKTILDTRATGFAMVPAGIEMILRLTGDRLGDAREHLRYMEIGSAAMSPATKTRLAALLPTTRICHHYGLTEASRAAFIEYHSDACRLDSIGKASPNVEIAIMGDENHPLPDGEVGELAVRGGMVMQEYWKQPELTQQVLRAGWLRTGDLGRRTPDGSLYLVGRKNDLINVGGKKVSPEEIEAVINQHPAVVESAGVGMPDPQGLTGECIKACVVLRNDVRDEELVDWLRGRLEEHKIPRVWQRVERLAKTPSGKIQRHLM